ncbi:hypothetical protein J4Q44_G00323090 [Coregonus suidteri]|uniref:Uncharacterized protein n=1 Tax=Coregonus suidteri TaxID=861788 RepID=A0AAN8QG30_9TELE
MQKSSKLTDRTGTAYPASLLSQGAGLGRLSPGSWASSTTSGSCPAFMHFCLEESDVSSRSSPCSLTSSPNPSSAQSSSNSSRISSSSEAYDSPDSWSSGATCLRHSSISKLSQEVLQARLSSPSSARGPHGGTRAHRLQGGACCLVGLHEGAVQAAPGGGGGGLGRGRGRGRGRRAGSVYSLTSSSQYTTTAISISSSCNTINTSVCYCWLEQKVEAKLKFSQFLDDVSGRVLVPGNLEAFRKLPPPPPPQRSSSLSPRTSLSTTTESRDVIQVEYRWSSSPPCSVTQQRSTRPGERRQEERDPVETPVEKTYLETNIDSGRREDELKDIKMKKEKMLSTLERERRMGGTAPPPEFRQDTLRRWRNTSPVLWDEGLVMRYPYRSISLPRGINMVPDEEMNTIR